MPNDLRFTGSLPDKSRANIWRQHDPSGFGALGAANSEVFSAANDSLSRGVAKPQRHDIKEKGRPGEKPRIVASSDGGSGWGKLGVFTRRTFGIGQTGTHVDVKGQ